MRNILKIASLLDYSGQYNLSDKLFKTAQENQQQNKSEQGNVENYSIDAGKNNFFNNQMQADQESYQRFMMMNTNTPENFVKSLFEFSKQNNINNLVQAFDAYANAGASYNGNLIKNVPILRELYMRVRNTPRMIPQQELAQELTMLTPPQKTTSNLQGKESQDLGTYWYEAVMREPLDGLETFKNEVLKDQELNESQKNNLIKTIDQRIMNKR